MAESVLARRRFRNEPIISRLRAAVQCKPRDTTSHNILSLVQNWVRRVRSLGCRHTRFASARDCGEEDLRSHMHNCGFEYNEIGSAARKTRTHTSARASSQCPTEYSLVRQYLTTMFHLTTVCIALSTTLLAHAAPLVISTLSLPRDLKTSTNQLKSPEDGEQEHSRDLGDPIFTPSRHAPSPEWVYLVAKILAGLAVLSAIFILIFFLYRRRVRGRRRRIGEMMGLGIKRNEIVRVEREQSRSRSRSTHHSKGSTVRSSHKDPKAWRWRTDLESGKVREEKEERGRKGRDRMRWLRAQSI